MIRLLDEHESPLNNGRCTVIFSKVGCAAPLNEQLDEDVDGKPFFGSAVHSGGCCNKHASSLGP